MVQSFWDRVDSSGGPDACWPWTGWCRKDGYGKMRDCIAKKSVYPHRYSLELKLGREVPRHLFTIHSCDNPPCCNPKHLTEGTSKVNQDDANSKARRALGEKDPRAILSDADVREIRTRYAAGLETVRAIAADFRDATYRYIHKICAGNARKLTA